MVSKVSLLTFTRTHLRGSVERLRIYDNKGWREGKEDRGSFSISLTKEGERRQKYPLMELLIRGHGGRKRKENR